MCTMEETWRHCVKGDKPGKGRQIQPDFTDRVSKVIILIGTG
jgi:hypothetical protein